MGIKIKKGDKIGKVEKDENGMYRILTVRFEDGSTEKIWMSNLGKDGKEVHEFEWFCEFFNMNKWVRF